MFVILANAGIHGLALRYCVNVEVEFGAPTTVRTESMPTCHPEESSTRGLPQDHCGDGMTAPLCRHGRSLLADSSG